MNLFNIISNDWGYKNSQESKSAIDANGKPIPWMTYSAVFFLDQIDMTDFEVFEWGSGNSSLFFSERVKSITSVEMKQEWYDYVKLNLNKNMNLLLRNKDNYASSISEFDQKYDMIIIDGEIDLRMECALQAVDYLKDGGLIVLDNSDWLTNTTSFLRDKELIQVDMSGPGPINPYPWSTSFFLHKEYKNKPKYQKQPLFVTGGIKNVRD